PVLGTLDAMHGVGMIHRDVAPDNIFVCEDGKIKLLDFGAARVVSDTDEKTLSVMLKAGYAPVEQYSSKAKQGAFTDVYAACAAMYKMLTGETPPDSFTRDKDGSDLKALTQTDAPPTAQETILHGMALNAADRIGNAKELLDTLRKDAPESIEGIDPKQFLHEQKKKQTKKIARAVIAAVLVVCITVGGVKIISHFKKAVEPKEQELSPVETISAYMTEQQGTTLSKTKTTTEPEPEQANAEWMEAYKNYLFDRIEQVKAEADDPDEFEDYSTKQFSLIYLDDDDVPEMVVSEGASSHATLVTYNGTLHTYGGLGFHGSFQYKERQGIVVEGFDRTGIVWNNVWHLKQGILECVWSGSEQYNGPEAETGYSVYDVDIINMYKPKRDDEYYNSIYNEKIRASEKRVSQDEYEAGYKENMPSGLVYTSTDYALSPQMTQKNVEAYFAALTDKNTIIMIRSSFTNLTLTGTWTNNQQQYNEIDYCEFALDKPVAVQFEEDEFPALLTTIYCSIYESDPVPSGHATITGTPFKGEIGEVWMSEY
ncbi:MAG: protein kinase, partial [Clostridia bacterium]|nr:protein kinase [Clostridia bacterium]